MKRIAVFIDGTWNRRDAQHQTNVVLLSRCVKQRDAQGNAQQVIYSPGVGAGSGNNWLGRQVFYHGCTNRLSTDPQTRNYLQDAMGARDNRWIPDYIVGREAPEVETALQKSLAGLVSLKS